jgi:Fe-S cluster biogenesis protein NfuA
MNQRQNAMSLVEFEPTPNPDALCVRSGQKFLQGLPVEFDRRDASAHPLAAEMLAIEGVERVMIAPDFVTVVRTGPAVDWEELRPLVVLALMDAGDAPPPAPAAPRESPAGEVEQHIEDVLNRYVRHLLAADGGEAALVRFDAAEGTAWVRMGGACGGCPSGITTLKRTIEQTIKHWVPEVKRVLATGDEPQAPSENPKARFRRWVEAKWGKQQQP